MVGDDFEHIGVAGWILNDSSDSTGSTEVTTWLYCPNYGSMCVDWPCWGCGYAPAEVEPVTIKVKATGH